MENYIAYILHMFGRLMHKDARRVLGNDNRYIKMLKCIIDESIVDMSDDCQVKARDAFEAICQDPEIHKVYFPIHIDSEKQSEWLRHVLCGQYLCAPNRRLQEVYSRSWDLAKERGIR
jgi:hypothetical protein